MEKAEATACFRTASSAVAVRGSCSPCWWCSELYVYLSSVCPVLAENGMNDLGALGTLVARRSSLKKVGY